MPAASPTNGTDAFWTELPLQTLPLARLMTDASRFAEVPSDWHVVLTDVKKSTQALNDGMHHLVNLVATGSIIAALNIARRRDIRVPFFFGGDGATLAVPDSLIAPVIVALNKHRENTKRNFGLNLRVGSVPVRDIQASGHSLSLAKVRLTESFTIPVVLGQGFQYAERIIKGEDYMQAPPDMVEEALNLEGMECRWDNIRPPSDQQAVLCLLIVVKEPSRQGALCGRVLELLDQIFGSPEARSPVAIDRLRLKPTLERILRETRARKGGVDPAYALAIWLRTLIGYFYLRYVKAGRHYLRGVAMFSDTLVIDGKINTVIAGTAAQRARLTEALDALETAGDIAYGLHVCNESVMSCYVRDRKDDHIHFVDGIGGGYTQAAIVLKRKLAAG